MIYLHYGADQRDADSSQDSTQWLDEVLAAVSIPVGVGCFGVEDAVRAVQKGAELSRSGIRSSAARIRWKSSGASCAKCERITGRGATQLSSAVANQLFIGASPRGNHFNIASTRARSADRSCRSWK